jgi:hypothetical protein
MLSLSLVDEGAELGTLQRLRDNVSAGMKLNLSLVDGGTRKHARKSTAASSRLKLRGWSSLAWNPLLPAS